MLGRKCPSDSDSVLYFDRLLLLKRYGLSQTLHFSIWGLYVYPDVVDLRSSLSVCLLVEEKFRLLQANVKSHSLSTHLETCHHLFELVQRQEDSKNRSSANLKLEMQSLCSSPNLITIAVFLSTPSNHPPSRNEVRS